ncbi:MAG: hypothetical protein R2734_03925 [Nocardioides sp.]
MRSRAAARSQQPASLRRRLLRPAVAAAAALALVAGASTASVADPDATVPTRQDVADAEAAADAAARTVDVVRTELALANEEQRQAAVAAAQAVEAFNGARWKYQQARAEARQARAQAQAAAAHVAAQQAAYADTVVGAIETPPALQALGAMLEADGISSVLDDASTLQTAEGALDDQYDAYLASATVADVTATRAAEATARAARAKAHARDARDAAVRAQARTVARTRALAARKGDLLAELARLEGVGVALATERQRALERRAPPSRRRRTPSRSSRPHPRSW